MDAKVPKYLPFIFRSFQGYKTKDIKEYHSERRMEVHLKADEDRKRLCHVCGSELGNYHDKYHVKAKHLKAFNWTVEICFFREKRNCEKCKKVRCTGLRPSSSDASFRSIKRISMHVI